MFGIRNLRDGGSQREIRPPKIIISFMMEQMIMLIISLIVRQTQVIPKKTITFMALENWHTKVNIYILVKQVQEVMVGWN